MPTFDMPDRPHVESFRKQARDLQRAVREGNSDALALLTRHLPGGDGSQLSTAQLVIARAYGYASWPRLVKYAETVAEHNWETRLGAAVAADPADEFCRLACLTYSNEDGPGRWAQARQLLADHPGLTTENIWAAAAAGRPDDVGRLLAAQPRSATERGGPFRWRPLFYLVYSRVEESEDSVAVARLLLDAGADPDEGYLFDALPSPFTLLTGVFGQGELGPRRQPRHPHWRELARLLLDAGANPNDAQTLYNRMFEPDDTHLELLFEYGLGTGDGGPWKRRIDELQTPAHMLRIQLRWAVEHHQPARVRLLAEHGVNVRSPFTDDGPRWSPGDRLTPLDVARLNGDTEIADYLVSQGAAADSDPVKDLIAAAFSADRPALDRLRAEHPDVVERARESRPSLIVWAAARSRPETVSLLAELGFDVNAYGRGDAPVEQPWETALHQAAGNGDVGLAQLLLDLGADPDARDHRFGATPLDWARHLDQPPTAALLEPVTTDQRS